MTFRARISSYTAGYLRASRYAGFGVRGDQVPATGTSGPGIAYPSLSFPADNAVEIKVLITTPPIDGVLDRGEDTGFTYTAASDGTRSLWWQLYKANTATGAPQQLMLVTGGTSATAYPSGVSASASVGTPVAVAGASIPATALPAGISAVASVGAASATGAARALPAGVGAFASIGQLIASGAAWAYPAGVQASASVGLPVAVEGTVINYTRAPSGGGYQPRTQAMTTRPAQSNTARPRR